MPSREVRRAADGVPIHMDGARLFNAEVATGNRAATFAHEATTVMCCLSKGLCTPVGSLLAGQAELDDLFRLERKRLGGAMRQARCAGCGRLGHAQLDGRAAGGEGPTRGRPVWPKPLPNAGPARASIQPAS